MKFSKVNTLSRRMSQLLAKSENETVVSTS